MFSAGSTCVPAGLNIIGILLGLWFSPKQFSLGTILTGMLIPVYCLAGWVTMRTARFPIFQWLGFAVHFGIVSTATYFAVKGMLFTKFQDLALAVVIGGVYSLFWLLAAKEQNSGN